MEYGKPEPGSQEPETPLHEDKRILSAAETDEYLENRLKGVRIARRMMEDPADPERAQRMVAEMEGILEEYCQQQGILPPDPPEHGTREL